MFSRVSVILLRGPHMTIIHNALGHGYPFLAPPPSPIRYQTWDLPPHLLLLTSGSHHWTHGTYPLLPSGGHH